MTTFSKHGGISLCQNKHIGKEKKHVCEENKSLFFREKDCEHSKQKARKGNDMQSFPTNNIAIKVKRQKNFQRNCKRYGNIIKI